MFAVNTFNSVAEDAILLNNTCIAALKICIEEENGEISSRVAVARIRKLLIDAAFSLDLADKA